MIQNFSLCDDYRDVYYVYEYSVIPSVHTTVTFTTVK